MTFIDKSSTEVQFTSPEDALDAVKFGQYRSVKSDIKLVSKMPVNFWTKYVTTGSKNLSKQISENSNFSNSNEKYPNVLHVRNAKDCIDRVFEARGERQCYICLGIFDSRFRTAASMSFELDKNGELKFRRVGLARLTSMVYGEDFPWMDSFEEIMTRFSESGIYNLWIGKHEHEFVRSRKTIAYERYITMIDKALIYSYLSALCLNSLRFAFGVFFLELLIARRNKIWSMMKQVCFRVTVILQWIIVNVLDMD
jgi:hypothetical protein